MTTTAQIGALEALLARVVSRRGATRVLAAPAPASDLDIEVFEGTADVDPEGMDDEGIDAAPPSLGDSVADLGDVAGVDAADTPASSKRPIQPLEADESELSFEDVDAPPAKSAPVPPESGRQVAVPKVAEFEGDRSGIRWVPDAVAPEQASNKAPTTPPAARAELHAEITKPSLPVIPGASPAVFHGSPPSFEPATFGELLDATLDI